MPYQIRHTRTADADLEYLSRREQAIVRSEIARYLRDDPVAESTKRRPMEPNPLDAVWELRLGDLRVYYDVDRGTSTVTVLRVGVKRRERVLIQGRPIDLRQPE